MKKIICNENFYNLNVKFPLFVSFIIFALSVLSGIFINYNFFVFISVLSVVILLLYKSAKPLIYFEIFLCFMGSFSGFLSTCFKPDDIRYEITGVVDKRISDDYSYIKNIRIYEGGKWEDFKGKIFLSSRNSDLDKCDRIWSVGYLKKTNRYPFYSFDSAITGKVPTNNGFINLGGMIKESILLRIGRFGVNSKYISSIIFGDKEKLTKNEKSEIFKSGIGHLFAVSGFHIGLFYFLIAVMVSLFLLPYKFKLVFSLSITFLYWLTTGPSISASRAFLMLLIYTIFKFIDYPQSSINIIGLCGIIFLILSPIIIANISFQLSFVATSALLIFSERVNESKIKRSLKVILIGCIPQLALLPLQIVTFNSVSLLSVPLTILFVPLFLYPIYINVMLMLLFSFIKLNFVSLLIGTFTNYLISFFDFLIKKAADLNLVLNISENLSYICALLVAFLILSSLSWHSGHKP